MTVADAARAGGELFGDKILELYTHYGAAHADAGAAAAARSGAFRRFAVGDVILVSPDGGGGGGRHPLDARGGAVEGTVVERGAHYLHVAVAAWPAGVWGRRRRGDAEGWLRFRVDRYYSDVPFVRMTQVTEPAAPLPHAAASVSTRSAAAAGAARCLRRSSCGTGRGGEGRGRRNDADNVARSSAPRRLFEGSRARRGEATKTELQDGRF